MNSIKLEPLWILRQKQDAYLVLLSGLQVCSYILLACFFEDLSLFALIFSFLVLSMLICTNYQCVGHYFIHRPFFRSKKLNRVFSVFNSIGLGLPQSLYKAHHMIHHQYNNGENDPSSLKKYSKSNEDENLVTYSLLGPFRGDIKKLILLARRNGQLKLVYAESTALLLFFALTWAISPQYFFLFFLPLWYFGQVLAYAENYFEHNLSDSTNRLTDSVSCYSSIYNKLWFNNGFHQEHHLKPQIHWTQLPQLKEQMLPESERRVVPGAHFCGLFTNRKKPPDRDSSNVNSNVLQN